MMLKMVKGSESSDFDCYRYLDDMGVPYIYFILIFLLHSLQLLAQVAKPIPHIVNLLVIPLRIYTHKSTFAIGRTRTRWFQNLKLERTYDERVKKKKPSVTRVSSGVNVQILHSSGFPEDIDIDNMLLLLVWVLSRPFDTLSSESQLGFLPLPPPPSKNNEI